MTISIEVNGTIYNFFDSARVFRSVETVSGEFSFATTSSLGKLFPIRSGSPCKVKIKDQTVINGFVEDVSVDYDSGSHSINISGRDKTADLIDSTIGNGVAVTGPITLANLCKFVLEKMGLTAIKVIDSVGNLEPFQATELASAEFDKSGFEFLESYARQRQVFLTGDGNGNINIVRSAGGAPSAVIQNVVGRNDNNVLRGSYSDNRANRFNLYFFGGGQSPIAFDFGDEDSDISNEDIVNQEGQALDNDIRPTRRLHAELEQSGSKLTSTERAKWEANIRRSRGKRYTATVQGFFIDNKQTQLWRPNILVSVNDEFTNINANMLLWSVTYNYSVSSGSTTELVCASPDALTLSAQDPSKDKKNQDVGGSFSFDFSDDEE